ncbi:MAG TPA: hypothetical protein VNK82_01445 [Terriglobales bacterium]|nr:hypothetical protein [Terriglobales bacterium]
MRTSRSIVVSAAVLIVAHLTGALVVGGPLHRMWSTLVQMAALMAALSCFLAAYRSIGALERTLDMLEKRRKNSGCSLLPIPSPCWSTIRARCTSWK